MFGLRMENQFIMNIDVNTTNLQFQYKLQELLGINNVTVLYNNVNDTAYSYGNRICTSVGKNVTIIFNNVTFPQYNGNVPNFQFTTVNQFADIRSGLDLGMPTKVVGSLSGIRGGYRPFIVANEVVKGFQKADATAYYSHGSGTNTITFSYIVQSGDFTDLLEVRSINFNQGYVFGNITGANVSTAVPNFGSGPRYMSISPSSLGFNRNITITSAAPEIVSVTSPNANAVYTQGDVIFIHVVYNLPVKVFRPDLILLQLATGAFDRSVPLIGLTDDYFALVFQYTVQQGDFSTRLSTLSYNSLFLNGGAIYRRTSTNETSANVTLPIPGSPSSLSGQKSIVVNTLSSQIVLIKIISETGVSTAGDNIDFNVLYENAVFVTGSPRLLIQNTPQQLQAVIRNAPYLSNYSFTRALPSNDSQVVLSFQLNWQLNPHDMLKIRLPSLKSTSLTVVETLSIAGSSQQFVSSALWDNDQTLMSITFNSTVKSGSTIDLVVQGRSGLFISSAGIIPSESQFSFDVISSAVLPTYTKMNSFKNIAAVGFASLSLSINPPTLNVPLDIGFSFSVPETLQVGDTIALHFKGFNVTEPSISGIVVSDMPYFRFDWYNSSFHLTVTLPTSQLSFVVHPSRFLSFSAPSTGVNFDSVTVTASMANNGYLDSISIQNITRICGSTLTPSDSNSVSYMRKLPISVSPVQFTWQVGPVDFNVGDSVVFTLPYYNSTLGILSRIISRGSISGQASELFTVFISGPTVTFQALGSVPALQLVSVLLDTGAGLVVPPTGIRPYIDYFNLLIVAATCKMSTPLKIYFTASEGIVSVSTPIFQVLPKSSLKLGSRVGLLIQFEVFSSFVKNDAIFVTIPNFSRNVLIDPRNNSIVSNANLTSRYNRLAERLEFLFGSVFDVSNNAVVSVLVEYAQKFSVPTVGMSNNDFQLSISSGVAGQLNQQVMSGPCLGFCSGALLYSTLFKEEPLTLSFNMSYSKVIHLQSMNLTFALNHISLHGKISGTISIYSNASSRTIISMSPLIVNTYSDYIVAHAPVTIPAQYHFVMTFHGLYYMNTSSTITPQVSVYDSRLGGSPTYTFSTINVLDNVYFSNSSLSFRYSMSARITVVQLMFKPSPNLVLNIGDYIIVYLPAFKVPGNNAHGLRLSSSSGPVINSTLWKGATFELILYPHELIDSTVEIALDIYGFVLPSKISTNCSYSIGLHSVSVTSSIPFQQVSDLLTLQNYSLALKMNDSSTNINHLSKIEIEVTISATIQKGSIIVVEIPYLFQNSLNASYNEVYLWIDGSHAKAVWLSTNSSIRVQVEHEITAGVTRIEVNTTRSYLQLTTAGIPSTTYSAMYLYHKSGNILAFTDVLLPCMGICDASLTLAERKAGYPTLYNVSILLGFSKFSQGDVLYLQLEGFTKSLPLNENMTLVSQGYGNSSTEIFITWDDSTTTLIITPAPNATLISQFLNFQIPKKFGLKCPSSGIRFNTQYVVNWTIANSGYSYGRAALSISPVGYALQSAVQISPLRPNSAATMTFSWTFSDMLQEGDQIYIYLNKFIVPSGAFIVYNSSIPAAELDVTGYAASDYYQTNPDTSVHVTNNQGYLIVTINADIPAGDVFQFKLFPTSGTYSSGITLPVSGVYHNTLPRYAVVSKVAPIATGSFLLATSVGSLSPSKLNFEITPNKSMAITVNFMINCPIFENDFIVVMVPNLQLINSRLKSRINVTRVNSSSAVAGGGFSVKWLNKPTVLRVQVAKGGYVLSGPLQLVISATNIGLSNRIVYPNDIGYQYSLHSSSCSIRNSTFDSSEASYLISSEVAFKNNTIIGSESPVRVSLTPEINLRRNDTIRVVFPAFRLQTNESYSGNGGISNFTHTFQLSDASTCLNSVATATYSRNLSSLVVELKLDSECGQMSKISFLVQTDMAVGILLPPTNVAQYASTISIRVLRWSNNSLYTLFKGFIKTVQPVEAFSQSQIVVGTPVPSSATDLTVSWSLTQAMLVGDVVNIVLRDFTKVTTGLGSTEIVAITGSAARFVSATWDNPTKTLRFRSLSVVQPSSLMTAYIPLLNGFLAPANGISSGTTAYEIFLSRGNTIILSQVVAQISVVPIVQAASISFIASDYSQSYNYGGVYTTLQLNPGHELTEQDVGAEIVIDGSFYQINNVDGELLTLSTAYKGTRVLLGSPTVPIYTPPFRYANYLNGSNTANLIFRYKVRRGDHSSGLGIYNPTGTKFNTTHQSLEFNNGNILRLSQSPAIVVSTVIPSYAVDYTRQVNTDKPNIVELMSSSAANTYSAGQMVDFQVKFDSPVSVDDAPHTRLQLLLDIHPFGRVIAYYASGSGTNTIVFVYAVNQVDDSKVLGNSTYGSNDLVYSYVPLRVITTYHFTYLRRYSTDPTVDTSVDFPVSTIVNVPIGLKIVGIAPKVISWWVSNNSRNDNFTAGDKVYLYVRYSSPVKFSTSNNDSTPYIWLDLGSYNGSLPAQYSSMFDASTLAFSYTVTTEDKVTNGLYLLCTCKDYFNRTFMMMNGSSLYSHLTNSSASLLLANSSDSSELLLRSDVVIDNSIPFVEYLSNNASDSSVPLSPGDMVLISVHFSAAVTIQGIIKLLLKGDNTECKAYFYSGNNTNTLNFLYMISFQSGVSKLDCTNASAMSTKDGKIFRLSDSPIILANTGLPIPGSQESLGLFSSTTIDTSPRRIVSASANVGSTVYPSLSTSSVGLNLFGNRSNFLHYSSAYNTLLDYSTTVNLTDASVESYFDENAAISAFQWGADNFEYVRLILMDAFATQLRFLPLQDKFFTYTSSRSNNYWWTAFNVQSKFELKVNFDRDIEHENAVMTLNTGSLLNKALSSPYTHLYYLVVNLPLDSTVEQTYRLQYGGYQTACISVGASAKGPSSVQESLESIPAVKKLSPNVNILQTLSSAVVTYEISFTFLPTAELYSLSPDQLSESCPIPVLDGQVTVVKDKSNIFFEYNIQSAGSIVMMSSTVIKAGRHVLHFRSSNGISISSGGVSAGSAHLSRISSSGKVIAQTLIEKSSLVPDIVRSSLSFDGPAPNQATGIAISLCSSGKFSIGDSIQVYLPHFNLSSTLSATIPDSSYSSLLWLQHTSGIQITLLDNCECINEVIPAAIGFMLPNEVIYADTLQFLYSVSSASLGTIAHVPFKEVTAVGINGFTIEFSNPTIDQPTSISIDFEIIADFEYSPDHTHISLCIPRFYTTKNTTVELDLASGPDAHAFSAMWSNATGCILLKPTMYLYQTKYSLTIAAVNPARSIVVPSNGLYLDFPPTIAFHSEHWSTPFAAVSSFPFLYGSSLDSELTFQFIGDTTYLISAIEFRTTLSRHVSGPGSLIVHLPCVTSKYGDWVFINSTHEQTVLWSEEMKTLTVTSQAGWTKDIVLALSINESIAEFFINSLGIEDSYFTNMTFAINGSNGFLSPLHIAHVQRIPRIQHASLSIINTKADLFESSLFTVRVELMLNFKPELGDTFDFNLYGLPPILGGAQENNSCFVVTSNSSAYTLNYTSISVLLSNISSIPTNPCHYTRKLVMFFTEQITNNSKRSIIQYQSNLFHLSWNTSTSTTGQVSFDNAPVVGVTYSRLDISSPAAGKSSELTFKILTATILRNGDSILLGLPHFEFNFTSAILRDNYNNSWIAYTNSSRGLLSLTTTTKLHPSGYRFSFLGRNKAVLPSMGITSGQNNLYTVTIARDGKELVPQAIKYVTPVGFVNDIVFHPQRVFSYQRNSDGSTSAIYTISFSIMIETNSLLNNGDILSLQLPQYVFIRDIELQLPAAYSSQFKVELISAQQTLQVTLKVPILQNSFYFETLPSFNVQLASDCSMNPCSMYISISSQSCPVSKQQFHSEEVFTSSDTAIRFYHWSNTPTMYPTESPTVKSNTTAPPVSTTPTTSPSMIPTREPASTYTASPTTVFLEQYFVIEVTFSLLRKLSRGSVLQIKIPQLVGNGTTDIAVMQDSQSQPSWTVQWFDSNAVIECTALRSLFPGRNYILRVGSGTLRLNAHVIYAYNPAISYKIVQADFPFESGVFPKAYSSGLKDSSLAFTNPIAGSQTAIELAFSADDSFNVGDTIIVTLPQLVQSNAAAPIIFVGNKTVTNTVQYIWDVSVFQLSITFLDAVKSIDLTIPLSSSFTIPTAGLNQYTNTPTVNVVTYDGKFFMPTTFERYVSVAGILMANITFPNPVAGVETPIIIVLYSKYSINLQEYDVMEFGLPTFWSLNASLIVTSSSNSSIRGSWVQCREVLQLMFLQSQSFSTLQITVTGMRLPKRGVSEAVTKVVTFDCNSTASGVVSISNSDMNIHQLGEFSDTSLIFYPMRLQEFISMVATITYSEVIDQSGFLCLHIPGVTFAETTPLVYLVISAMNTRASREPINSVSLNATWLSASHNLVLNIPFIVPKNSSIQLLINNSIQIPSTGQLSTNLQDTVSYSIQTDDGRLVSSSPVSNVSKIGLVSGLVKYDIPDMSQKVSIQFELQFSGKLLPGDNFTVESPVVHTLSASTVDLIVSGDQADNNFGTSLTATFTESTGTFMFIVTAPIVNRLFTVFVGLENALFVNKSTGLNQNLVHYFTAGVSSIGTIGKRAIDHFPEDLFDLLPSSLNIAHCALGIGCDVGVDFTLSTDLAPGDMVVLSHRSFSKLGSESVLNFTSATESSHFYASWRAADNVRSVELVQGQIDTVEKGFIRASADYIGVDANVTFPAGLEIFNHGIVSYIPQILSVYATYPFDALVCNDSLDIFVVFDKPVLVQFPVNLRMLLNTHEFAYFYDGNLTTTLRFRYYSIAPTATQDLAPLGPGALEFLTDNSLIVDASRPNVAANTSIPGSYGHILRSSTGYRMLQVVECSTLAAVIQVVSYSKPFVTYGAGDVLDVQVIFTRPVQVQGRPYLRLTGNTNASSVYIAEFANVSTVQWIDIANPGWYSLSYSGSHTACIFWNDSTALLHELSTLQDLTLSLPVSIEVFYFPYGFRYKLMFSGVAPYIIKFHELSCDYETSAFVSIDSSLWNSIIFRYTVVPGDVQSIVNYINSTSFTLNSSTIFLSSGGLQSSSVNISLPELSEPSALAISSGIRFFAETPLIYSVYSNFSSTLGQPATSGDLITITVNYSAPIYVPANVSVYFDLELINHTQTSSKRTATKVVRSLELSRYHDTVLFFEYLVQVGDSSHTSFSRYLSSTQDNILKVKGGNILLRSAQPSIVASLDLPVNTSGYTLTQSHILVNATTPPIILNVTTLHKGGIVHAGEEIRIAITFSSNVSIVESSITPFIPFLTPTSASMSYYSGSGTPTITFLYQVEEGNSANHTLSFNFFLKGGHFRDSFGNSFSNYSDSAVKVYHIRTFIVDTVAPVVLYVNTTNLDGTYHSGSKVVVYVVFNKPVVIIGSGSPSLQLLIEYPDDDSSLAHYISGNGSRILYFEWTIPSPNYNFPVQSPMKLDYGGISALYSHLNGCSIRDISTNPTTEAVVLLPLFDKSFLTFHREVYISFELARVSRVYSLTLNGTYSAGDEILIVVEFTQKVMVFTPPILRLVTGMYNRSAVFVDGNYTERLVFKYTVQLGDNAKKLDYIDTRFPPYRTIKQLRSMALSTDVLLSESFLNGTSSTIFEYPTNADGGVFMASETIKVPCYMDLPLPGQPFSLSRTSTIVIDPTPPYIKKVTVPLPDGTYGDNVIIPVITVFSANILVGGCPRILFNINGVDKYATYVSGGGGSSILFHYTVSYSDSVLDWDYFDRYSFQSIGCNVTQQENLEAVRSPLVYVLRASINPQVYANLTMPWVKYVESVIAPVSITGGGKHINLAGAQSVPRLIWTTADNYSTFSLGDIVDVYVGYSRGVLFPLTAYINLTDITGDQLSIYSSQQVNDTTIRFTLAVRANDFFQNISYFDQYSLRTQSSCSIFDKQSNACAAQNLPPPFSAKSNALDSVSPKGLKINARLSGEVESIRFEFSNNSNYYTTGSLITIVVSFSTEVVVIGSPMINLFLDGSVFHVIFKSQVSPTALVFTAKVDSSMYQGNLKCTAYSTILLNGGMIIKTSNFLPLLSVDTSLSKFCCPGTCENPSAVIIRDTPVVLRVYSNQLGVFSAPEAIVLFVQMSTAVKVVGSPTISLDLYGHPNATFVSALNDTLQFQYTVQSSDCTSSLDYVSIHSLQISHGLYDGIYLSTRYANISANLTLPYRGAPGSLGREAFIVINNGRANIVSTFALPTQSTSGDEVNIVVRYSEAMQLTDSIGNLVTDTSLFPMLLKLQLSIKPSSVGLPVENRLAYLKDIRGTDVTFIYDVTSKDPTGSIYFANSFPLVFNSSVLKSIKTGTEGPKKFPDSVAFKVLASIDNNIPVVVNAYSPNVSTTFPFGVGDVIDIYVEMSLGVVVYVVPRLALTLNNRADAYAEYIPQNASLMKTQSVKTLHFRYTVASGDSATPLEYTSTAALSGFLLRYSSSNPTIVADLTLPEPFSLGSLGYCCNVQVDSSQPYIQFLNPLKRVGIYGENETIFILARFNKPVVVYGTPSLKLNVGSGIGYAKYVPTINEYDIIIDISNTDVIFQYTVQRYDNVLSLHHTNSNAFELTGGSRILHRTNSPVLPADVSLRDPSDTSPINNMVDRQWKFRYPRSVEVLLRDLYHTKPDSLTASIQHVGYTSTLFSGCCTGKSFGNSYPRSRTGTNATTVNMDAGVGGDFMFSDTMAVNIAPKGSVTQSSTKVSGNKATDNNVDPLIGDNSVSETSEETDPWWQVLLPSNSVVQTIVIWAREPQEWIPPVVSYTIKGLAKYPQGFYKLSISNIDLTNGSYPALHTAFLSMSASDIDVQAAIQLLPGVGNVEVTKRMLPLCASDFTGCGQGFEHGYGYVYELRFSSLRVALPSVKIVDIKWIGQQTSTENITAFNLPVNEQPYQIVTHVDTKNLGYYIQTSPVTQYGKGVPVPPSESTSTTSVGSNEWLTPFWVFLFDSLPPTGINASIEQSIWYQRYESIDKLINIVLKKPYNASYVKIQREGYGFLSFAEVQVYEKRLNTLGSYDLGSPVAPSYLTNNYQAEIPLGSAFQNVQFDGRWLIQLTQDFSLQRDPLGFSGSYGTISEVVLVITDLAGVVHSYYQDLKADIQSLPKFGHLITTSPHTSSPYGDWREAFEVGAGGQLTLKLGLERSLGYCYGNQASYCANSFGVGPLLNIRQLGDTPETYDFREERVVIYQPAAGYLGPDYFTYIIYDGLNVQTHTSNVDNMVGSVNEVTIHVRKCRRFQAEQSLSIANTLHPLCVCAQTELSLVNNTALCDSARRSVCTNSTATPTSHGFYNFYYDPDKFSSMCLSCFDASRGLRSGDCLSQTIRSVSYIFLIYCTLYMWACVQVSIMCVCTYTVSNNILSVFVSIGQLG